MDGVVSIVKLWGRKNWLSFFCLEQRWENYGLGGEGGGQICPVGAFCPLRGTIVNVRQ
jgi:hypothetical protein